MPTRNNKKKNQCLQFTRCLEILRLKVLFAIILKYALKQIPAVLRYQNTSLFLHYYYYYSKNVKWPFVFLKDQKSL